VMLLPMINNVNTVRKPAVTLSSQISQ